MRSFFSRAWSWAKANKATLIVLALTLALDRLTKCLTLAYLTDTDIILAPFLHLRYVQNTGAAFGILQNGNLLLIFITLLIMGYLLKNWSAFCAEGVFARWGLVLILGGALGNLYDRIALGFVVDFIDFRVWPVFNAADSFITIGAVLMLWAVLFNRKTEKEVKK